MVPDLVGVICAGTSDLPVLEESKITLQSLGLEPTIYCDIGVAGLHRFLLQVDSIRKQGSNRHPRNGRGSNIRRSRNGICSYYWRSNLCWIRCSFGLAPLLGMLNSCSPGVLVCNIDNGYGAALAAFRIYHRYRNEDDTIDPVGGLAGDMLCAGLFDAGLDLERGNKTEYSASSIDVGNSSAGPFRALHFSVHNPLKSTASHSSPCLENHSHAHHSHAHHSSDIHPVLGGASSFLEGYSANSIALRWIL